MTATPISYLTAFDVASRFLERHSDAYTRIHGEDLAQEAALEAWSRAGEVREPRRFAAYVRTISRRIRCRALERAHTRVTRALHDARDFAAADTEDAVRVEGRWFERAFVLDALDSELGALGLLNERIVRGFYEGFTCRELAVRYGISEAVVKVRLHRGRRKIHRGVVRRLRRVAS